MPKILLNPFRNILSFDGLTLIHDSYLDQGVKTTSDVIHKSIHVEDLYASGRVLFTGNITEVETEHLLIKDNIVDINADNTNTLLTGGFSIQRGNIALQPFNILYYEQDQVLKIGFPSNMQSVATREDTPNDKFISVWDSGTNKFITTDTLSKIITFQNTLVANNSVSFGNYINAPKIVDNSSTKDLILDSSENILLGTASVTGKSVIIPIGRKLQFGVNSFIQADITGGLVIDSPRLIIPASTRLQWGGTGSVYSTSAGNTVNIDGTSIELNATNEIKIISSSPITHAGIASFQPGNGGSYIMSGVGDIYITPGSTYNVIVPNVSLNKKVLLSTDNVGNLTVDSLGDIYLNPASKVFVNQNKSICFGVQTLNITGNSNNLLLNSGNGIILNASFISIPVSVPLNIANGTSIYELGNGDTVISSGNNIILQPFATKNIKIGTSTSLIFSSGEQIYSDGLNFNFVATSQINLSAPLGVKIAMSIPILFGDNLHRIYQDISGNMQIESSHVINLNATESVNIAANLLTIADSRIYTDTDTSLTLKSPVGINFVKIDNALTVTSTDDATLLGNASIKTFGGIFISKNLIVETDTNLHGLLNVADVVSIDSSTIPIKILNKNILDGTAIEVTSRWDATSGYSIGRGTTSVNGGRSLSFTVPRYYIYGIGSRPGFYFGTNQNTPFVSIDDVSTTINQGTFTVTDTSNNAVLIQGRATLGSLVIPNVFSVTNSILVESPIRIKSSLTLYDTNNETLLISANELLGLTVNLNSKFTGNINITGLSSFQQSITALGGISTLNDINMNMRRIRNLQDPSSDTDAATKFYVDSVAQGLSFKQMVESASTMNHVITDPIYQLDDVIVYPMSRVLLKNQMDPLQNGIYQLDGNNVPVRPFDMDNNDNASGAAVFVTGGTVNGGTGFVVLGNPVIVGVNDINWTAFSGASQIQTGPGMSRTGNTLNVVYDDFSISTTGNALEIKNSFFSTGFSGGSNSIPLTTNVDQSHVSKIGTITSGIWNASIVQTMYGGTGRGTITTGKILAGNGTDTLNESSIYYENTNGNIGINTTSPSATLQVSSTLGGSAGAWLRIDDQNALVTQDSGIIISSAIHDAKINLSNDGTLNIGQNSLSNYSKIRLLTQRASRLIIDSDGNIAIGTDTPTTGNILTVSGNIAALQNIAISGNLILPNLTIQQDGNGKSKFNVDLAEFTNDIDVASNAIFGNLKVISSVSGETTLMSLDRITNAVCPLKLRASPLTTSAICTSDGFLIPDTLQIGGIINDPSTGFNMRTIGNVLNITPGIVGNTVLFNTSVSTNDSILLIDKGIPNNPMVLKLVNTNCYIQPKASSGNATYSLIMGSGSNEMIVLFTNKIGNAFVKYDPTETLETTGGVFEISSNVLAKFGNQVHLYDSLRHTTGNSVEGILVGSGWYYLGQMGIGRTCITGSLSWRIRIDYDGMSNYIYDLLIYDRNVISLTILKSDTGVFHLYLRVISGPCKIVIFEAPNVLNLNSYEGSGSQPDGSISGYTMTWTTDLDLLTAQSNSQLDFGKISVSTNATINNATLTGTTQLQGMITINTNVNPLVITGDTLQLVDPISNSTSFALEKVNSNNNRFTISGILNDSTSVPELALVRGNFKGSFYIADSTDNMYPDSLMIKTDSNSKIVFGTKNRNDIILDDLGNLTISSTAESIDTDVVALLVEGGAIFKKKTKFDVSVTTPQLKLINGGNTLILESDSSGFLTMSNKQIKNVGFPINPSDVTTKEYVDDRIQGLSTKDSVIAASANNNVDITIPLTLLDGTIVADLDRVLLKDQSNPVENGIYVVQYNSAPVRSDDLPVGSHSAAVYVFVNKGDVNANSGWTCSTPSGIDIVGVNSLTFVQFSGAGQFNAGPGLQKVGNTISVLIDNSSIELVSNYLRIKSSICGQGLSGGSGSPISVSSITHLNALGTITSGVWRGTAIGMQYGGTGSTLFSAGRVVYSNGVSLTQGNLYFDDINNRLGINTTNPSSGLTVQDRDIQINQNANAVTYMLLTSTYTNYSFAMRNDSSRFILSGGIGTNKLALTDFITIDNTGNLSTANGINSQYFTIGSTHKISPGVLQRTTNGSNSLSLFSADNTGSYINLYGGLGTATNSTNSEFMRLGFYNGEYIIATKTTGNGIVRNLTLQTGNNMNQLVLNSDGSVNVTGKLTILETTDSTSTTSTCALNISGGLAVEKSCYVNSLFVNTNLNTVTANISSQINLDSRFKFNVEQDDCLLIQGTVSGNDSLLHFASKDTNNLHNVYNRIFGYGKDTNSASEWLQLGYNFTNSNYEIRMKNGGAGNQKPLILSATESFNQIILNTDGSTVIAGTLIMGGTFSIASTQDAVSASNGGSLSLAGGLGVVKSVIIGGSLQAPITKMTTYMEMSNAGGIEKIRMRYTNSGQLHLYNNSNASLSIHTGISDPLSANQEKLILGYLDSSSYTISSTTSGIGTNLKDLHFKTGNNTDQLRLLTDGSVKISGNIICLSTQDTFSNTTGALQLSGGLYVAKNITSDSIVSCTSLKINSLAPWTFVSDTLSEMTLQPLQTNTTFSIKNNVGSSLFSISTDQMTTIFKTQFTIKSDDARAFNIQSSSGHDLLILNATTGVLDIAGNRISNLGNPSLGSDAATKMYVDNLVKGLNLKDAVLAASTANVDIMSPVSVLDSVTLVSGDRILLMNQTNLAENGIYVLNSSSIPTRADDLKVGTNAAGSFCFVQQGIVKGDKGYVCFTDFPNDVVGTNAIEYTQFNGNIISAGEGLYKDGNNIMNIRLDTESGLAFNAGKLRINDTSIGQGLQFQNGILSLDKIKTVDAVIAGSWQASIIDIPYGGTGNNLFPNTSVVYSDGTKLVGNSSDFTWDYTKKSLGINGVPDPNNEGDGLTVVDRDITVQNGGFYISNNSMEYAWSFKNSAANPIGTVTSLPSSTWTWLTMSITGDTGVLLNEPGLGKNSYLTKNQGQQWIKLLNDGTDRSWGEPSISGDGTHILLCALQDYLYVSSDSGNTFIKKVIDIPRVWEWTSVSNNGQYMLASALADGTFISTDGGATFTEIGNLTTDPIDMGFVHVCKNGALQYAGYYGDIVYTSTNNGSTFVEDTNLRSGFWYDMMESYTGNVLVIFENPGTFFVSTNLGVSWMEKFTDANRNWISASISDSGDTVVVAEETGCVYLSTNYGSTFNQIFGNVSRQWNSVQIISVGPTGPHSVFAGGRNMPIYNTEDDGSTYTTIGSNVTVLTYSFGLVPKKLLYYVDSPGLVYRYSYSRSTNLIISGGKKLIKSDLSDVLIINDQGNVGIGYVEDNANLMSNTLDVIGTLSVSLGATFGEPLSVSSGGTGKSSISKGIIVSDGMTFNSTGNVTNGYIPIGSSDNSGNVVLEGGATLRNHIGLAIGSHVQAYSLNLDSISSLNPTQGYFIMGNGSTFEMASMAQAQNNLGLGDLAYLDTVNNSNWNGSALSISNGGTGNTTFTQSALIYFDGTNFSNSNTYYDSVNGGISINGNSLISNTALTVHGKNMAIKASTNTTPTSVLFYNADGVNSAWKISRVDDNTSTGNCSLIFSGGVPSTNINNLVDRMVISPNGVVSISNTTDSNSVGLGSLIVNGGISSEKSINTNGIIRIFNTTDYTSSSSASLVVYGGVSIQKNTTVAGSLSVINGIISTSTVDATSDSTASVTLAGGLGISKNIWTKGSLIVEKTSSSLSSSLSGGLTVGVDTNAWIANTIITNSNRTSLFLNSGSNGAVILGMKNLQATNGWDLIVEGTGNNRLIWQSQAISNTTATTWMTLDSVTGALTLNSSADAALSIVGGISCVGSILASNLSVVKVLNGGTQLEVSNTSSGSSAYSRLKLTNNAGNAEIKLNSSNAVANSNTLIFNNNIGAVRIASVADAGVTFSSIDGSASFDSSISVHSTEDAISENTGGALTISGGTSIKKSLFVGGDVTVTGIINVAGSVENPTLTTPSGDMINVTTLTVFSTTSIKVNNQIMLTVNFKVTPTTDGVNTQFTFILPNKVSDLLDRMECTGQISGYVDNTNLFVLQNMLCTGIVNSKKVVVKFQSNTTSEHCIQLFVSYSLT